MRSTLLGIDCYQGGKAHLIYDQIWFRIGKSWKLTDYLDLSSQPLLVKSFVYQRLVVVALRHIVNLDLVHSTWNLPRNIVHEPGEPIIDLD